jgi:replicative DNA helicase
MELHDPKRQDWQILKEVLKTQKMLAQNLQVACLVLSQLNPDGTLQGAKQMANDCDLILKLIPINQEEIDDIQTSQGVVYDNINYKLEIVKNRDDASGSSIPMFYDKETQRMRQSLVTKRVTPGAKDDWSDIARKEK